jgi:hypothetical protein
MRTAGSGVPLRLRDAGWPFAVGTSVWDDRAGRAPGIAGWGVLIFRWFVPASPRGGWYWPARVQSHPPL